MVNGKEFSYGKQGMAMAKKEAKKKEVSVGNVREIVKLINEFTDGELYKLIKKK